MSTWPSISNPSIGSSEEVYLPQIRQDFEANYVLTRKIATRSRRKWSLSWKAMLETEYQLLHAFFIANQGSSFTWVHPLTSVSYTCIFSSDSISSNFFTTNARTDVQCMIEEL